MALTRPAGSWRYKDLFTLPDDSTRYEIIDGDLYEMPFPTWAHAIVNAGLVRLLLPVLDRLGGLWVTAPLGVFFTGTDPVQPDLVVLLPDSRACPVRRGIEGPPDLLIEVLNPSNRAHDQVRKRTLYAQGGVREYWSVDPDAASIEIIGADGETVQLMTFSAAGDSPTLRSPLLGDLAVDAASLFPGVGDD